MSTSSVRTRIAKAIADRLFEVWESDRLSGTGFALVEIENMVLDALDAELPQLKAKHQCMECPGWFELLNAEGLCYQCSNGEGWDDNGMPTPCTEAEKLVSGPFEDDSSALHNLYLYNVNYKDGTIELIKGTEYPPQVLDAADYLCDEWDYAAKWVEPTEETPDV